MEEDMTISLKSFRSLKRRAEPILAIALITASMLFIGMCKQYSVLREQDEKIQSLQSHRCRPAVNPAEVLLAKEELNQIRSSMEGQWTDEKTSKPIGNAAKWKAIHEHHNIWRKRYSLEVQIEAAQTGEPYKFPALM